MTTTTNQTPAQLAYEAWTKSHKLQLRVYTDSELFCLGYNARNKEVEHLENVIDALTTTNEQDAAEVTKVEEVPKPKKAKKEN